MADEILWPLRGVSKDPNNLLTLGSDGQVMADSATTDARYVKKAGDTMTGPLAIHPPLGTASTGAFSLIGEDAAATLAVSRFSTAMAGPRVQFNKARGTAAAPAPIAANDNCGAITWSAVRADGASGNAGSISMMAMATPAAGEAAIKSQMIFNVGNGSANATVLTIADTGITATNVTATGTTKTVSLEVSSVATFSERIIHNVTAGIGHTMTLKPPAADQQASGVVVNIAPEPSLFSVGFRVSNQGFGINGNRGIEITDLPEGADNYAILNNSLAASYFRGNIGISALNATHKLEVNGTTMLRGTLEITGNITSSGTAHSFASRSIPTSAVIGSVAGTVAGGTAPGASGTMIWDENFLYLRTATAWKKIALAAI